ncbi:MAG: glycosyltransferase family 4 protein, partial [Bryobacteraceae bacterium]
MTIWLFNPYGPIPGEAWRDYRFTMIAETLAAEGHRVIWWTAAFSHHFKRHRSFEWKDIDVSPEFTVRLVPTPAYRRHIGFGRLWFELVFAVRAWRKARTEPAPSVVLSTDPPQVLGVLGAALAKHHHARLVIDVMDLWPEIFAMAFPKFLRKFAPLVFAPLYAIRRRNFRRADALTALCDTYMTVARRAVSADTPTQIIYNGIRMANLRSKTSNPKPVELPVRRDNEVWAIYAGTLGDNYDIPTLLDAMKLAWSSCAPLRLLVAGDGPLLRKVIGASRRSDANVTYLGKLDPDTLAAYYAHCQIGVCAYGAESNVAMPDKAYDYMAAGLAIVNSLPGELASVLKQHDAGRPYMAGNPYSLAEVLEHLAYRPAECKRLGDNALVAAAL